MSQGQFEISIVNENGYDIEIDIHKIIAKIVEKENVNDNFELAISFVENDVISKLYENYFGYAKFTDVLSFYSGDFNPETGRLILGDIIISYPFAKEQAKLLNNKLMSELSLLIIHGFFHLLGYDHSNENEKDIMWQKQESILTELSLEINNYPEN